jgi:hypothetical protein
MVKVSRVPCLRDAVRQGVPYVVQEKPAILQAFSFSIVFYWLHKKSKSAIFTTELNEFCTEFHRDLMQQIVHSV